MIQSTVLCHLNYRQFRVGNFPPFLTTTTQPATARCPTPPPGATIGGMVALYPALNPPAARSLSGDTFVRVKRHFGCGYSHTFPLKSDTPVDPGDTSRSKVTVYAPKGDRTRFFPLDRVPPVPRCRLWRARMAEDAEGDSACLPRKWIDETGHSRQMRRQNLRGCSSMVEQQRPKLPCMAVFCRFCCKLRPKQP